MQGWPVAPLARWQRLYTLLASVYTTAKLGEWLKDPELERLQKNGAIHQVSRLVDFIRRPYLAEGVKIRQGYRALFGERRIEESPIPLVIQACDLTTGEAVMLRAGPVAEALAASSAVPSIFPPVAWHGRLLIDGDVAEKVPVTAAKALQAGPVVAVDVSNRVIPSEPRTALEAALQAGEASRRRLLSIALSQADLVIALEADPPSKPSTIPRPRGPTNWAARGPRPPYPESKSCCSDPSQAANPGGHVLPSSSHRRQKAAPYPTQPRVKNSTTPKSNPIRRAKSPPGRPPQATAHSGKLCARARGAA